jgi:hypothetical protein
MLKNKSMIKKMKMSHGRIGVQKVPIKCQVLFEWPESKKNEFIFAFSFTQEVTIFWTQTD